MKKYQLSCLIFLVILLSCSKTNNNLLVHNVDVSVGDRVIANNTLYIKDLEELKKNETNQYYGMLKYLDSQNMVRKIEWYHNNKFPYYTIFDYHKLYSRTDECKIEYVDTNLIREPIVNTMAFEDTILEVEAIFYDYPATLVSVTCKELNFTNFELNIDANTLNIEYRSKTKLLDKVKLIFRYAVGQNITIEKTVIAKINRE